MRLTEKSWRNLDPWECCGQDKYCKRECHEDGGCAKGCVVPKLYAKLAAYEDLEEQGRLVVLPCKVGDKVYIVDRGKILEEEVIAFNTFKANTGEIVTTMTATYGYYITKPNIKHLRVLQSGNKLSFFFSRAEAERAMEVSE